MHLRRSCAIILLLPGIAACGDGGIAPDDPVAPSISASASSSTLSCSSPATHAAARKFFASGSDPIFPILRAQATARGSGKLALATDLGFDALAQVAAARGTKRQKGTGADAEVVVRGIVGCMAVGQLPEEFDVAAAIDRGIFEVRGGKHDAGGPALAFAAAPRSREFPSTQWGIEAPFGWAATFGGKPSRYLVYAWPRPVPTFTDERPSVDASNVAYTGFDIFTLPATPGLAFAQPLRPGICAEPQDAGLPNRLLHGDPEAPLILALSPLEFCDGDAIASASGGSGMLRRLASLFLPREAHAYFFGGVGGLASSLSPFGSVQVDMSEAQLVYTVQPTPDGQNTPAQLTRGEPFTLQLRLTTRNGTPIEGASVSVAVQVNRGKPVVLGGENPVLTDEDGRATFSLTLSKNGGYRLESRARLGEMTTPPVVSSLFTVKD